MNTITAISRVTLSKFLNFSLPHFSHPQNGGNYNTQQIFLKKKKEACRSAQPPKITHNTFSVSIGFIVVLRNWKCQSLSHAQLFSTPWTAVCQAPLFMGFSIKNSRVGCHALLQRIFLTQGSNPHLLHCRQILYRQSHQGSPLRGEITHQVNEMFGREERSPLSWVIGSEKTNGAPCHVLDTVLKAGGIKSK